MVSQELDQEKAAAFGGQLMGAVNGGMLALMIDVGHRTGLFEAAAQGPASSEGLAGRAGLSERHVREWLGAMVSGGVFEYEPDGKVYTLPPEHALSLTGKHAGNMAPMAQFVGFLGKHLEAVGETFRNGGGVPYSVYRPEFTELMASCSSIAQDEHLIDGFIGSDAEIRQRMTAGANVADIGCGAGHAINLMAQAFPASTFTGYDIAEDAIATARAEAQSMGLGNANFELQDVATLDGAQFDVVTVFDAIHDQAQPQTVLNNIARLLTDDGIFLMIDFNASSNLEENLENPMATLGYTVSTLHCMQVSLADDGAGLGAMWGDQIARRMLAEAGFKNISRSTIESDPLNAIYVCRK